MTELYQISSLEKVMPKSCLNTECIKDMTVLHGEDGAYQIAFKDKHKTKIKIEVKGDICEYVSVYSVGNVPVMLATFEEAENDPNYISKEPGMYPDILNPVENCEIEATGSYQSLWVRVDKKAPPGLHNITVELSSENETRVCCMEYKIIDISLPESDIVYTQWFHVDCLAVYYNVPMWSEEHWCLIEKYIKTATGYGINMILTPIFTPPLDTAVGGERPTTQLVGVTKEANSYTFDFTLLKRWIKLCLKCGIKYFEVSHLFTQWGSRFTPKIIAEENGEEKRIFSWDVSSEDKSYENFLEQFLPCLVSFLKEEKVYDSTYFHISDEPKKEHLEYYLHAKKIVTGIIPEEKIIDALSEYEFYRQGITQNPIVAIDHMNSFVGKVKNLWGYYCCVQVNGVSNRMIAMPSVRNRYISLQMYKYRLKGFLHWGYNFYYSALSIKPINPMFQTDGDGDFPAGDPFSVYPGKDGPIVSIRLAVFYHALQDLAAMRLLEEYIGYDETLKLIESVAGNVVFDKCASKSDIILKTRQRVNERLEQEINKTHTQKTRR